MRISIITPVFNRQDKLWALFQSLKSQTLKNFEWIIIDDGSTDETPNVIAKIQECANFPIISDIIPHSGKHFATHRAYQLASGDYALELDSDDSLVDKNSLHNYLECMKSAPEKAVAIGVCFIDQHGHVFPQMPNTNYIDYDIDKYIDTFINNQELLNISWFMKLDYAKSVLPPLIDDNLTYFPEAVINLTRAINASDFLLRVYNLPLYKYNTYQSDSVSVHTQKTNAMWYYFSYMVKILHKYGLDTKYHKYYNNQIKGMFNYLPPPHRRRIIDVWNICVQCNSKAQFIKNIARIVIKNIFSINLGQITVLGMHLNLKDKK